MLKPATLDFITELRENNHRDWFHAQKKRYEAVKTDYKQLVTALLTKMQSVDPALAALTPKDCTFRIARDIRFSADKTPYKTHFGIGMSTYGKRSGMAEYYVHLEPGGTGFTGGGVYMPSPDQLAKIRREIDVFGDDLVALFAADSFKTVYPDLDRELVLSRPPKGYDASHKHINLLKLKSYTAVAPISDDLFTDPDLVSVLVDRLRTLKPFIAFLNRALTAEEEAW